MADCFVLNADSRPRKSCSVSLRFPTSARMDCSFSLYPLILNQDPLTASGNIDSFTVSMQ